MMNWNQNTLVGNHPLFVQAKALTEKAKSLRILFYGATGAGKTPFARYSNEIVSQLEGKNRPFEQLNCACLNPEHFQDLLFGHKKGAFTGAIADKKGLVELADGGDLFLDEIGDMPLSTQAHFLTFLDSMEYYRLGDDRKRKANIRVICATNRDLKKMVEEGTFRRDLYSRISQVIVNIPSLAERATDIPLLVNHFIARFAGFAKPIEKELVEVLTNHAWIDGNIRELKDTVEYLCLISRDENQIRMHHLGDRLLQVEPVSTTMSQSLSAITPTAGSFDIVYQIGLDAYMEKMEKSLLEKLLAVNDGCMEKLAKSLKTSRSTLYRKLKKYDAILRGEFESKQSEAAVIAC